MSKGVLRYPMVRFVAAALLVSMLGACGNGLRDEGTAADGADADQGPPLLITVKNGRSVEVDDSVYADSGVFRGRRVDRSAGRVRVRLGDPGKSMTQVSMGASRADSLILVHVDASTRGDKTILIYGAYGSDMAAMTQASSPATQAALFSFGVEGADAAKAGWECIWCRGDILACGIEPQCGRQ